MKNFKKVLALVLALAMALCRIVLSGADVLLLDEPTAAMDIESTMIAEDIIRRYRDKNDAIIIMVTHSINQARPFFLLIIIKLLLQYLYSIIYEQI